MVSIASPRFPALPSLGDCVFLRLLLLWILLCSSLRSPRASIEHKRVCLWPLSEMHRVVLTTEALSLTQQAPESYQSRRGSSEHSSLVAPVASFTESHTLCSCVSGKPRRSSSASLTVSMGVMGLHIRSWVSYGHILNWGFANFCSIFSQPLGGSQ